MAEMTYSVVARSCNRMLIGKTFWKCIVLPSVLREYSVLVWTKEEMEKLQRVEKSIWRQILGAPSYVAVEALRGEVGCSAVIERGIKVS